MVNIIQNSSFWYGLACMKNHLEPLAQAANATQDHYCRLDDVVVTFGSFYLQFHCRNDPTDTLIQTAVFDRSFVAAVLLHPKKLKPFFECAWSTNAGIYMLVCHLYICFFGGTLATVPVNLYTNNKYLSGTGNHFGNMENWILGREQQLEAEGNRLLQQCLKHQFGAAVTTATLSSSRSILNSDTVMFDPCTHSTREGNTGNANIMGDQNTGTVGQILAAAADQDDLVMDDFGGMEEKAPAVTGIIALPLQDLFDFNKAFWTESPQIILARGLEEEPKMYELLDLDAEGDLDGDENENVLND
ncbi:hypothetical protein B0H34DRAFT_678575 [Crassisporium funariophilum]|nr:hypothetical protein B0H34DRAFT_678575 [Crassisporium funariophilum]